MSSSIRHECIGCGACEAICPRKSISVGEDNSGCVRIIDHETCTKCGLCDNVCPIDDLNNVEDYKAKRNVYLGKSKDSDVIDRSASGGVVSEILIDLFETEMIDAAIVAFYDNYGQIYGDVIESKHEVLNHAGSYYHISKQLINIKKIEKFKKVAIVGLPCHINGAIRFCKTTNNYSKIITIALFCTIGRTYEGFRKFFKKETGFDVKSGNVKSYFSRFGENKLIHIEDDKSNVYECLDELYKFRMDFFYANQSCLKCRKLYGFDADISVGDAWHRMSVLKNGTKEKLALLCENSETGKGIIESVSRKLNLKKVENSSWELIKSQRFGAGLKIVHNETLVQKLMALKRYRGITNTFLLFRIVNKYRGILLNRLEKDSETIIKEVDNKIQ